MNEKELQEKKDRLARAIMFRVQVGDEMLLGEAIEHEYAFKLAAVSQRLMSLRREWLEYKQEISRLEAEIDAPKDGGKAHEKS